MHRHACMYVHCMYVCDVCMWCHLATKSDSDTATSLYRLCIKLKIKTHYSSTITKCKLKETTWYLN